MTELEFLKVEREKIKNMLKEYDHKDPFNYQAYLSVYRSLNEQITKITDVPDITGGGPFKPYPH